MPRMLEETAQHISDTERRSMAAERDTTDRYLAAYLSDRVGSEFAGRISGVQKFGAFVKLDETGADGLIGALDRARILPFRSGQPAAGGGRYRAHHRAWPAGAGAAFGGGAGHRRAGAGLLEVDGAAMPAPGKAPRLQAGAADGGGKGPRARRGAQGQAHAALEQPLDPAAPRPARSAPAAPPAGAGLMVHFMARAAPDRGRAARADLPGAMRHGFGKGPVQAPGEIGIVDHHAHFGVQKQRARIEIEGYAESQARPGKPVPLGQ